MGSNLPTGHSLTFDIPERSAHGPGPCQQDPSQYGRHTINRECHYDADWIDLMELLALSDPPAESAIPFLEQLIASHTDRITKEKAIEVLQRIRTELGVDRAPEAVSYHIRMLTSDPEPNIRLASLAALIKGEPPSHEVRHEMVTMVSLSSPQRAAGPRLNPLPAEIWPAFMERLSDPSDGIRLQTVRLIDSLGQAARPLLKELLGFGNSPYFKGFKSPDGYGQDRFYKTIAHIDPDGTETIPLLQDALADPIQVPSAMRLLLRIGSPECREIVDNIEQPIVNSVVFSPDGQRWPAVTTRIRSSYGIRLHGRRYLLTPRTLAWPISLPSVLMGRSWQAVILTTA